MNLGALWRDRGHIGGARVGVLGLGTSQRLWSFKMGSFSSPGLALVSAVLLLSTGAATAQAAEDRGRLTLTAEAGPAATDHGPVHGQVTVAGSNGRYDHLVAAALRLPLRLSALPAAGGESRKILASQLSLKQQSSSGLDAGAGNALGATVPVRAIALSETFEFTAEPQGSIAQNAIALCNGLSATDREKADARRMTMPVPLVWRLTTGRLNFNWRNYDRVAPSDEILNNRDFYTEQETVETELAAHVVVSCQPLGAAVTKVTVEKPAATQKTNVVPEPAVPADVKSPAPEPVKTVTIATAQPPVCHGGMIRETGSSIDGYLCLCPGNTVRVETGAQAFACERKTAHR